jgi:hypothetical protein
MAIVFAQPQPLDVAAAYSSGLRENMEKDRAFALTAWKAGADQFNSNRDADQRAYQFEAQRQPSNLDVFKTEADIYQQGLRQQFASEAQQNDIAAREAMQNREFTHADNRIAQRLRQNQSQVDAEEQAGRITPQEAARFRAQVTDQLGYYQILEQNTRNQSMQQQQRLMSQQMAHNDALQLQRQRAEEQNGGAGMFRLADPSSPETNLPGWYRRNPNTGGMEIVPGTHTPRTQEMSDGSTIIEVTPGHWTQSRPPRQEGTIRPADIIQIGRHVDTQMDNEIRNQNPPPEWAANATARANERRRRLLDRISEAMGQTQQPPTSQMTPGQQVQTFEQWWANAAQQGPGTVGNAPPSNPMMGAVQGAMQAQ